MSRCTAMDQACMVGFEGHANPHIYSSSLWCAHELGAHLKSTGRPAPAAGDVRMSRGYSIRCRDMVFAIGDGTPPSFERIK